MQYARFYIIGSLQLEDTFFALSTYKIRLYYDNKLYKIPELPPKLNLTSLDMCEKKVFRTHLPHMEEDSGQLREMCGYISVYKYIF